MEYSFESETKSKSCWNDLVVMEDLYSILGCEDNATFDELKKRYQKLALKFHPDKIASHDEEKSDVSHPVEFSKINFAWNILSDADLRKQYDIKWKQRCISQEWPIQDDVCVEEFDKSDVSDLDENMYTYPCRCGGLFVISETDIQIKFDIVCCDTCSLSIRILFDSL